MERHQPPQEDLCLCLRLSPPPPSPPAPAAAAAASFRPPVPCRPDLKAWLLGPVRQSPHVIPVPPGRPSFRYTRSVPWRSSVARTQAHHAAAAPAVGCEAAPDPARARLWASAGVCVCVGGGEGLPARSGGRAWPAPPLRCRCRCPAPATPSHTQTTRTHQLCGHRAGILRLVSRARSCTHASARPPSRAYAHANAHSHLCHRQFARCRRRSLWGARRAARRRFRAV